MLKLPGFGLQRFRSFDEHMQFVAPLGKVTLIAGQNNASKSNIMRFAHIVLGPAHGKSGVECGAPVSPTSMPPDATELLAAACAARSDLHEHSRHLTRDALEAVAKSPSCPARWGRQWVSGHLPDPQWGAAVRNHQIPQASWRSFSPRFNFATAPWRHS